MKPAAKVLHFLEICKKNREENREKSVKKIVKKMLRSQADKIILRHRNEENDCGGLVGMTEGDS